ncbi:MAG: hypothetical protein AB9891_02460 [Anaerolineaceae bacterium]
MDNKIEIINDEEEKLDLPKDPFEVIDAMDDNLIMEEIKGRIADAWVYHFKDETGREQWGLSKIGVDAACSELARRGEVIRELEIRHEVDPTDAEFILFTAKAGRFAVARDGREVLLDTAFGTKRQSTKTLRRDGSSTYNNFWFEHGSTKALRNARNRLISEKMRASIITYAREHKKTMNLPNSKPASRNTRAEPKREYSAEAPKKEFPISDAQKRMVAAQVARLGITEDCLKTRFDFIDISSLSVKLASAIITELMKMKTWQ